MPSHPSSEPLHVIVLAAGRGSRLGEHGEETPKWLLDLQGTKIADNQLAAIESAFGSLDELASMTVITGHAEEAIRDFLASREQEPVRALFNPDYAHINNWLSVLVGLREIDDPRARVIVINGDLVMDATCITRFVREGRSDDAEALVAVDTERRLTDESMKVSVDDGPGERPVVRQIEKKGVDDPVGEYVGMLMIRGDVLASFRAKLESWVGDEAAINNWYENAIGETADAGVGWPVWATESTAWVEVDDLADYESALALMAS